VLWRTVVFLSSLGLAIVVKEVQVIIQTNFGGFDTLLKRSRVCFDSISLYQFCIDSCEGSSELIEYGWNHPGSCRNLLEVLTLLLNLLSNLQY
jgi:hypothetical protein